MVFSTGINSGILSTMLTQHHLVTSSSSTINIMHNVQVSHDKVGPKFSKFGKISIFKAFKGHGIMSRRLPIW